jgi:hypothetical protein
LIRRDQVSAGDRVRIALKWGSIWRKNPMSIVNEITIQVPSNVAEMYHQATIAERQQMAERIGIIFGVFNESGSTDLTGFRNTLLDSIERSNPKYQAEMSEALEGAFSEERPTMSADEFGEWLANV